MNKWQLILEKSSPLLTKLDLEFTPSQNSKNLVLAQTEYSSSENDIKAEFEQGRSAIFHKKNDIKAVFFDMDSTVISEECIVELAKATGMSERVSEITERAMAGELEFNEAFIERVGLLKGADSSVIETVISSLNINPGMKEFSKLAKDSGIKLYLVSGGFIPMASHVAAELNFDGIHSNPIEVENDKLTGEVKAAIVDGHAKKVFVENKMADLNLRSDNIMVVGDGANDLAMMGLSEIAIGYKPKKTILCKG